MEDKTMKIDRTKTLMHLLYTYTGTVVIDDEVLSCFRLNDDFAFVLELPWSSYTVTFPHDMTRPLTVGDTVSIVYRRTHDTTPRLRWTPVEWYAI